MIQPTKILCFLFCTLFSINTFAEFIWGNTNISPAQVGVDSIQSVIPYKDVLSVDENGLLDNSNQIKIDFESRESEFPEMSLESADIQFVSNGTSTVQGCRGFNEDCSFISLTSTQVESLINNKNSRMTVQLRMFNHDITQPTLRGVKGYIYIRSKKTNNQYVELATYKTDIPTMRACIGHMSSNIWDLGKISPASFAAPRQITIGTYTGQKSAVVKFKSNDLVNNVLTMRDGDRTGPSVEFTGQNWFTCKDNDPNAVCGRFGTGTVSATVLKVVVNGISAEPGKYVSYLTSTVDCE